MIRLFAMTTFDYRISDCHYNPAKIVRQEEDLWAQTCPEDLRCVHAEMLSWGRTYVVPGVTEQVMILGERRPT